MVCTRCADSSVEDSSLRAEAERNVFVNSSVEEQQRETSSVVEDVSMREDVEREVLVDVMRILR
jgi:hypothetical protein